MIVDGVEVVLLMCVYDLEVAQVVLGVSMQEQVEVEVDGVVDCELFVECDEGGEVWIELGFEEVWGWFYCSGDLVDESCVE